MFTLGKLCLQGFQISVKYKSPKGHIRAIPWWWLIAPLTWDCYMFSVQTWQWIKSSRIMERQWLMNQKFLRCVASLGFFQGYLVWFKIYAFDDLYLIMPNFLSLSEVLHPWLIILNVCLHSLMKWSGFFMVFSIVMVLIRVEWWQKPSSKIY